MRMLRHFAPALAALLLAYCGTSSPKVATSLRASGGSDAVQQPAVVLSVATDLADGSSTNADLHSVKVTLSLANPGGLNAASLLSKFNTVITLTGPSGSSLPVNDSNGNPIANATQSGPSTVWQLLLDDSNGSSQGTYTVTITSTAVAGTDTNAIQLPQPWTAKVKLDAVQPLIAMSSAITSDVVTGSRSLTAHAWITNKTSATCPTAVLRTSDANTTLPLTFAASPDAAFLASVGAPAGSPLFAATSVSIANSLQDPFTIDIKCVDSAGNSAEFIQPVGVSSPKFLFTAVPTGSQGTVPGTSNKATFVQPGNLILTMNLLDPATSQPASAAFVSATQSLLRITITDTAPASLAALTAIATPLWTQPYSGSVTFALPTSYDAAKTIYVNLTEQNVSSNSQTLIGTIPVPIYVGTTGPSVSWDSLPQFTPFAAKVALTGQFSITTAEAPLTPQTPLALEYTTDGTTWTPLAATFSAGTPGATAAQPVVYTYNTTYPLSTEQPFRVHVKATDLAGNVTTSGLSPNLIGRPNLQLNVSATTRSNCAASGTPESNFTPWYASLVLCQQANTLGVVSGSYYAQLLLQNQGSAPIQFYSSTDISPSMGYQVITDGTTAFQGSFIGPTVNSVVQPPTAFSLSTTGLQLFDFAIQPAWLNASKVTIVFDYGASGANSIDNSCYAAGTYPSVVIQDKANGIVPISGPIACDTTTTLSP